MPIVRQPAILASWPTIDPVAPAAPETTTVSPGSGLPTSNNPYQAVSPVRPRIESMAVGGSAGSTGVKPLPSVTRYSLQPVIPDTNVPTGRPGLSLSTTSAMPVPRITSPISIGAT